MALGEAYLRGDFEIEGNIGDIAAIAETFDATLNPADAPALLRAAATLRRRAGATPPIAVTASLEGPQHSRERDQQAISYHYDVSNDFYKLWLDRRMAYSCAYFPTGTETLDEAQEAKLDLICRKLRLQRGEHLLDIGSGWGGLAIHAAQRYGARVLGVTLSEAQLHEARARAEATASPSNCATTATCWPTRRKGASTRSPRSAWPNTSAAGTCPPTSAPRTPP